MMVRDKRGRLIKPPERPQRPFEEDYPQHPLTDAQGQLAHDIEGRRLGAKFIAGRRFPGEADEPLSSHEMMGAMKEMGVGFMDARPLVKDTEDFVGIFLGDPPQEGVRPTGDIWVDESKAANVPLALAHEYGHAIDHFTRFLLSEGLTEDEEIELRKVYARQVIGEGEKPEKLQPEHFHYKGSDINRELVAEGVRAYMTNPNYFKTVAPNTAAKIRGLVNENPYLKDAIQFNSLGAIGLIGAGARSRDRDDK